MYNIKTIKIMTEKRFIKELCEELKKSIKTKKDVYLYSIGLDEEENKYSKEEDDNSINYYAWLKEKEMVECQKALFMHFWTTEEDMDKLHIVLDYVASENINEDTIIDEKVFWYNRLFMFWSK